MRKLFYFGIVLLILFEVANVYFIMPMPGSQEMNSISFAYFLHDHRWIFRVLFSIFMLAGFSASWNTSKILASVLFMIAGVNIFMTNFKMAADHMFYPPQTLTLSNIARNKIEKNKLVVGVEFNNEARAYPIQFLGFHHQVRDTINGKSIMVTYCTVCRTGRVFEPVVNGKAETFRLVGMDHYNAMFEDKTTKSWWRQENGEAVAGKLKGYVLQEFPSSQTTLENWLLLHPKSLIMQADTTFQSEYDSLTNYEGGNRTGRLTRRDTLSWQPKSWIAGIVVNKSSKAYDWYYLQEKQVINDVISSQPVVVLLADDCKSLLSYKRNSLKQTFSVWHDTLTDGTHQFNLLGVALQDSVKNLERIQAYQEYWHSWKNFHPESQKND